MARSEWSNGPIAGARSSARLRALALLLFLLSGCDLFSGPKRTPTTLRVTPTSLSFDAVGDTRALSGEVLDQDGVRIDGAAITWSSAQSSTAQVTSAGVVTSMGNGSTQILVQSGGLSTTVGVSVQQVATSLQIQGGNAQAGLVGDLLPLPLTVRVLDRLGSPAAGAAVSFTVVAGGGTATAPSATTGPGGEASTTWRLGEVAGSAQTLRASISGPGGGLLEATFSATAAPGAVAELLRVSGNGQSAQRGAALAADLVVRAVDRFANGVPNASITFQVETGGGSTSPGAVLTSSTGSAATRWTLGTSLGEQTLRATSGGSIATVFTATAFAIPTAVEVSSGNAQTAPVNTPLPLPLRVRVVDALGSGVAGVVVTFTAAAGSGSAAPQQVLTSGTGHAESIWTLGGTAGGHTLVASIPGGIQTTFSATATGGGGGGGGGFAIEYDYTVPVSAGIQQAFSNAAARWAQVITQKLPSLTFSMGAGECDNPNPVVNRFFDDLTIFVTVQAMDGPGGLLGSAGPCYVRLPGYLPFVGRVRLDVADAEDLLTQGRLEAVLIHEIGHVLGFGTLWDFAPQFDLLANPSLPSSPGADTHFTGAGAIAAFNAVGGLGYVGGAKVPVENTQGGSGTRDVHWRESVMVNELMTGFLNAGSNPLSRVSIASLGDMGYGVNEGAADAYLLPTLAPPGVARLQEGLFFGDDILRGPIGIVTPTGEVIGTVFPP